jgi:ubiquitin conjugation factor E4 B
MSLIKSGPEPRDAVLNFIAKAISINHGRGKMHFDRNTVSTDGFLFNICKVCLKLCEPIMDSNYSKVHLIDTRYFLSAAPRIAPAPNTTLISADSESLEQARNNFPSSNPSTNFVTDAFTLCLASHHVGILSSMRLYQSLLKDIDHIRRQVHSMRQSRDQGQWANAPDRAMKEIMYKRTQSQLDLVIAYKLMMETALLDQTGLEQMMRFYNLVMVWLLRLVVVESGSLNSMAGGGGNSAPDSVDWGRVVRGDAQGLPLVPLPSDVPVVFATLPEWIVEDVVEFFLFVCR